MGKQVTMIPHITDEIKQRILNASNASPRTEIVLVEIGGTVGDIESLPFLEAIRQFRHERPRECLNLHLTFVPYLQAAGELKSKPTQHSVMVLRQIGIIPDILLCRSEKEITEEVKDKISVQCSVPKEAVIDQKDLDFSIYELPLFLHQKGLDEKICTLLDLPKNKINLSDWEEMLNKMRHPKKRVKIGIVGKYLEHKDAYKSVFEALHHGAVANQVALKIETYESDKVVHHGILSIGDCDGYLVPGGFGERGWMGKILTAKHCREQKIPYFGLCLGMQVLCVEFARHVLNYPDANSTEMDSETPHPVISLLSEQRDVKNLGGTMRLGAYHCTLNKKSKAFAAYGQEVISERHRHRYEFNNQFKEEFEKNGLLLTGVMENDQLCEIAEIQDHPWMIGVQYHPEFKSRPTKPHPLFCHFIQASAARVKR